MIKVFTAVDVLDALTHGEAPLAMLRHVMAMYTPAQRPTDEEIAQLLHNNPHRNADSQMNLFRMIAHEVPALHVGYAFKRFRARPPDFFMEIATKCGPVQPAHDHNPAHILVVHCAWIVWREVIAILDALHGRGVRLDGGCRKHVCCGSRSDLYSLSHNSRLNMHIWFKCLLPGKFQHKDVIWSYRSAHKMGVLLILLARRGQLGLSRDVIRYWIAPYL